MNEIKKGELVDASDSSNKRNPLTSLMVGLLTMMLVMYLLNPLAGIDLLPDNLPLIGNLDEAAATAALIGCLSYFGVELPWMRKRP